MKGSEKKGTFVGILSVVGLVAIAAVFLWALREHEERKQEEKRLALRRWMIQQIIARRQLFHSTLDEACRNQIRRFNQPGEGGNPLIFESDEEFDKMVFRWNADEKRDYEWVLSDLRARGPLLGWEDAEVTTLRATCPFPN